MTEIGKNARISTTAPRITGDRYTLARLYTEVACHDRVIEWAPDEAHREVRAAKPSRIMLDLGMSVMAPQA